MIFNISAYKSDAQIAPIETFKGKQHVYLDGHWHTLDDNQSFVQMEDSVITAKYNSNIDSATKANFETAHGLTLLRTSNAGYIDFAVDADSIFSVANCLDTSNIIEFIKLNYLCKLLTGEQKCNPDDPFWATGTKEHLIKIQAEEMWYFMYCGPNPISNCHPIVAVIDNGLDISHPDLGMGADAYENIYKNVIENDWANPLNPTTGNNTDNGNNGFVDDWKGWDFTNGAGEDNDIKYDNGGNANNNVDQHGTKVAGIIAAKTFNGIGVSGIAGGWNGQAGAQIMGINVDFGSEILGSVVDNAIDYATDNGAKVVNMSFGVSFPAYGADIEAALAIGHQAGVIYVAAAGNDKTGLQFYALKYPATSRYTIAVGATENNDLLSYYSCYYGQKHLDLVAPHANITTYDTHAYITPPEGTSYSAPMVSGTIANMLCVNPCLTTEWARDILHVTADKVTAYYNVPGEYPEGFNEKYGYGRLNAYEAVKMAKSLHYTPHEDLYMKDCSDDMGFVGADYACTTVTDASPDIWIRNWQDGFTNDELQEADPQQTNYVYVRVRNKSCVASTANRTLNVYWSKAATWTSWPQNWDGTIPSLGNLIGTITLPSIGAGQVMTFEIPWTVPQYINSNGWNPFCILARVAGILNDNIVGNVSSVEFNNNVTIRNTGLFGIGNTIIGTSLNDGHFYPLGGYLDIVNPINTATSYDFHFSTPTLNNGNILTAVAEVTVIFDDDSWDAFEAAGAFNQNGVSRVQDNEVSITANNIVFENVELPANARFTTFVGTKFFIDSFTTDKSYHYLVAQTYADSNVYLGGENLTIKRSSRIPFNADAGADKNVFAGDSTVLTAALIDEEVIYEWYKGTVLKHTGRIYNLIADTASIYSLKVTAVDDAAIDYDNVNINIKSGIINSAYPNPCTNSVTVDYNVSNVSSASLLLVHPFYLTMASYNLNTFNTSINIDMSPFATSTYSLLLVCDNNIQDVKTIVKQ